MPAAPSASPVGRVEQQHVGGVVGGRVAQRGVAADDREGVARGPVVRLVEAGAQHRPARGHQVRGGGAAGELGQHQARGDRRGERDAHPRAAGGGVHGQRREPRPRGGRHEGGRLARELQQHAGDPLRPGQALGGRDGPAQRDPVPDHDDHRVDLLQDGADLVGHRGRQRPVLGPAGEPAERGDLARSERRVPHEEHVRGRVEKGVEAGRRAWVHGWHQPTTPLSMAAV